MVTHGMKYLPCSSSQLIDAGFHGECLQSIVDGCFTLTVRKVILQWTMSVYREAISQEIGELSFC